MQRSNVWRETLVVFGILFICASAFGEDADIIPPEILKQMDTDIRAGKKPTVHYLKQTEIFGLRENPKYDTDFVSFSFSPGKLSSIQRNILISWIQSGANNIYLKNWKIGTYITFLGGVKLDCHKLLGSRFKCSLLRHAVNTDCRGLWTYSFEKQYRKSPNKYKYELCTLKNLPEGSVIILDFNNVAAAGCFPLGRGKVYFRSTVEGTDSRRWLLNWWHWALGLRVPGAAETSVGMGPSLSLEEIVKYDSVELKNGDAITGTILNEKFTIKTSYASLSFDRDQVERIIMEGGGAKLDTLILRVGDRMSGVLEDNQFRIKLVSGTETTVAKDKISRMQMRRRPIRE